MPTIAQQFQQLQSDKQTLVTKLTEKGVTASNDETFTTLCPKVGDIQGGGGDLEIVEYMKMIDLFYTYNLSHTRSYSIKDYTESEQQKVQNLLNILGGNVNG